MMNTAEHLCLWIGCLLHSSSEAFGLSSLPVPSPSSAQALSSSMQLHPDTCQIHAGSLLPSFSLRASLLESWYGITWVSADCTLCNAGEWLPAEGECLIRGVWSQMTDALPSSPWLAGLKNIPALYRVSPNGVTSSPWW